MSYLLIKHEAWSPSGKKEIVDTDTTYIRSQTDLFEFIGEDKFNSLDLEIRNGVIVGTGGAVVTTLSTKLAKKLLPKFIAAISGSLSIIGAGLTAASVISMLESVYEANIIKEMFSEIRNGNSIKLVDNKVYYDTGTTHGYAYECEHFAYVI